MRHFTPSRETLQQPWTLDCRNRPEASTPGNVSRCRIHHGTHQGRHQSPGSQPPDITATLAGADPADKAAVYEEMGIDVTYNQDGRILVESRPRVVTDGVGGPIPVLTTRPPPLAKAYSITER